MRRPALSSCLGLLTVLLWSSAGAGQDVENLLRLVPADANTLAVLRVKALTESPRGQAEGWAQKHETEFLQGAVTVPPWADVLVRASYVRPGTRGGDWTVVLIPLPASFDLQQLAKREGTEVQTISELPAVQSSRYSGYFMVFGDEAGGGRILGGIAPATRQDAARWIHDVGGTVRAPLSDYLASAAGDSTDQIILSIDLRDMLDPIMIRNRINSSTVLDPKARKPVLVVDFQSLQGARLTIHTDQETKAEIRLDFGRDIGEEGYEMRALLNEFANDAGAAIDELADAHVSIDGKSVTLKMTLSDESLRRVMSLISTPPPPHASGRQEPATAQPAASPDQPEALASRRYFNAVNRNIDDLNKARNRATSYARTAQWHSNFADRIDRLPKTGVDPELLQYGRDTSARLRALGASLQGVAVQVNALDRSVVYNVNAQPAYRTGFEWWWGGAWTPEGPYNYGMPMQYNVTSNLDQVRSKQAEVVNAGEPDRTQIWQMILDDEARVQRDMVAKYGAEFQKR